MDDDVVDDYFEARQAIFDACDYIEVWRDCPLADCRGDAWWVDEHQVIYGADVDTVRYGLIYKEEIEEEELPEEEPEWYHCSIYVPGNHSPGDTGVFRGPDFVLVRVDTETDGNKFLFIFNVEDEYHIPEPEPEPVRPVEITIRSIEEFEHFFGPVQRTIED